MKKIFKVGAVALGMFTMVGVAVAENVAKQPKANENVYTWDKTGAEDPFVGTKSQAEDYYGCRGTVDVCAVGTSSLPGVPPAVIYQN